MACDIFERDAIAVETRSVGLLAPAPKVEDRIASRRRLQCICSLLFELRKVRRNVERSTISLWISPRGSALTCNRVPDVSTCANSEIGLERLVKDSQSLSSWRPPKTLSALMKERESKLGRLWSHPERKIRWHVHVPRGIAHAVICQTELPLLTGLHVLRRKKPKPRHILILSECAA